MKKFLSIVTSGTLALLMATTSVVTSFAYDGNDESAKATDAVSLEVVSDNTIPAEEPTGPNETVPTVPCEPTINYPQISGFSNTSTGTKISWNSYSGAVKYRVYVFNGKSWSRVGECTATNFTHNSLRDGVTYRYTVRGRKSQHGDDLRQRQRLCFRREKQADDEACYRRYCYRLYLHTRVEG